MATPTNLPAAFTSGAILTAAQMNDMRGAFRILQVVAGTTNTLVGNSTTTYVDTTLSATITPQSTSNKILVIANHPNCYRSGTSVANALNLRLMRGATQIEQQTFLGENASQTLVFSTSIVWLDSPNTTSATTYKTMMANNTASSIVYTQTNSNNSSIILLEVSA
jgi:hypothetical protein